MKTSILQLFLIMTNIETMVQYIIARHACEVDRILRED